MIEEPVSVKGTEASSDITIPSTGEVSLQLGQSHQVIHSNSVQTTTEIKTDMENLSSIRVEEHNVPSQSSCLIP